MSKKARGEFTRSLKTTTIMVLLSLDAKMSPQRQAQVAEAKTNDSKAFIVKIIHQTLHDCSAHNHTS